MAQTTVKQLADEVGIPVDRLLARLEAAWPNVIAPIVTQERDRARRALEALDALEPQLQ